MVGQKAIKHHKHAIFYTTNQIDSENAIKSMVFHLPLPGL
jgi:hypothetical protein